MRTVIELDDEEADRIVAAAIGEARRLGIAVSVAVVDQGGRLKRFARMDGAEIAGEVLAPHKAYSAIANSCDTGDLAAQAGPGGGLRGIEAAAGGAFTIVGGGAVLRCRGELVGAVGVSGGTAEEDAQSAYAARDSVFPDAGDQGPDIARPDLSRMMTACVLSAGHAGRRPGVAGLAVRLYLGGAGAPRGCFTWGQAPALGSGRRP